MTDTTKLLESWDVFYASALHEAESKINNYNFLISQLAGIKPSDVISVVKGLKVSGTIIARIGWKSFLAICALLAGGYLVFFGGMGALIAANPLLAAALVIVAGAGGSSAIFLIWRHRKVLTAAKKVGSSFKENYDRIINTSKDMDHKEKLVASLHNKCVTKIVETVFNINVQEKLSTPD